MSNIFTKEQINEFRNNFQLYQNKSNFIEAKYLGSILISLNYHVTQQQLNNYITEFNECGNISFNNFILILEDLFTIDNEKELIEAFRIFDVDNTGFINKYKLIEILKTIGNILNDDEINDLLKLTSIDDAGNIDYHKLVKKMLIR